MAADIQEYGVGWNGSESRGAPKGYLERFIHGGVYEARPEIQSVVHNHSRSVIPFGVTAQKLRPDHSQLRNNWSEVPVWEARRTFGDTDLLISNIAMGRDLAKAFISRIVC